MLNGANKSYYYTGGAAETAKANIESTHTWTITDGGGIAAVAPSAPSGLTIGVDKRDTTLRWTDNSDNETSFVVSTSTDGKTYTTMSTLELDTVFVTFASPAPGSGLRYYKVGASNVGSTRTAKAPASHTY